MLSTLKMTLATPALTLSLLLTATKSIILSTLKTKTVTFFLPSPSFILQKYASISATTVQLAAPKSTILLPWSEDMTSPISTLCDGATTT